MNLPARRTGALAVLLALCLAPAASADVNSTTITSPGDPYYDVANDANSTEEATVRGTSDGGAGDIVDLVCYGSGNTDNPTPGQNIPVNADGTFEGTVNLFDVSDNGYGCILRAVPDGTTPSNTSSFKGPRMLVTLFEPPSVGTDVPVHNGGTVKDDVYADFVGLRGSWYLYEVDDDPLYEGGPVNPRNLFDIEDYNSYYPVETGADWEDTDQNDDRTPLQVDGQNAYALQHLRIQDYDSDGGTPASYPDNVESLEASISQDEQGNVTITERYPLYRCETNSVFPPTTASCDTVTSAGVRVDRTKVSSDGGATFTVTDDFVSTDGAPHAVAAEYYNDSGADYEDTEYRLPGEPGYSIYEEGDLFEWPDAAPASMIWRDNSAESYTGAGAMTAMQAPDSSTWSDDDEWYTRFTGVQVPAGGASRVQQHYHVAFTSAEAESLSAARRDPLSPPAVAISGPTEGSVVDTESVNVVGTASDDTAVTSVDVNGVPTTLNPDGTFAQRVSLAMGQNVLTATATDRSGNSSQSVVRVTRVPVAPPVVNPPPGRGVSAVQLRTKRLRLGRTLKLRIRCVSTEAQNGTLELRTSKRPQRILGQSAFQCPAGGTRTVSFKLSRKRVAELRRKGKQRLVVDIVGRDLSGAAGAFTSRLTLAMPKRRARRG